MATSKPVSINLGPQQKMVDSWVNSGEYASTSEAMRDAVKALAREKQITDEILKDMVKKSLTNPLPNTPAEKVFADLRAFHAQQVKKAEKHGA